MVIKCSACGAPIEFNEGQETIECTACGSMQTLPKNNSEMIASLFDRANHFRLTAEFDKALSYVEKIIDEDREDSEAYWQALLCKYGVEYVKDPKTTVYIPTIHRVLYKNILEDDYYLNAIKYATPAKRVVYESEAKKIEAILKKYIDISKNEKPYDVFISYKETDTITGLRTKDSALAYEIYNALTKEGFKVFFSRITLESKLGEEYEPYIYAALNSAKAMIVVGTSKENIESPWVKNEWSRFLQLKNEGKDIILIPAYKDMDPYSLPDEFGIYQGQDLSKIGALQDIEHFITKYLKNDRKNNDNYGSTDVSNLIKLAYQNLEFQVFKKAEDYADRVLEINAECSEAYLVKLLAEHECTSLELLSQIKWFYEEDMNSQMILKYGDIELKQRYIQALDLFYENRIDYCTKLKNNENLDIPTCASLVVSLKEQIEFYDSINSVSKKYSNFINSLIETYDYIEIKERNLIIEKDLKIKKAAEEEKQREEKIRIRKLEEEIRKQEEERQKEIRKQEEERQKEKERKKKKIIIALAVLIISGIGLKISNAKKEANRQNNYEIAISYIDDNRYEDAYELLSSKELSAYKDSSKICEQLRLAMTKKGDTVWFSGQRWIVFDRIDDTLLLVKENTLEDYFTYVSDESKLISWYESDIFNWLNTDYYISLSDKQLMLPVDGDSFVTLLSNDELKHYCQDENVREAWGKRRYYNSSRNEMSKSETSYRTNIFNEKVLAFELLWLNDEIDYGAATLEYCVRPVIRINCSFSIN